MRAAVVPDGEIVLESTPNGVAGLFYEEWQKAEEQSYTKHFFPWWYEPTYREQLKKQLEPFSNGERVLVAQYVLVDDQIAWRRTRWQVLRDLALQEDAKDQLQRFFASGERL